MGTFCDRMNWQRGLLYLFPIVVSLFFFLSNAELAQAELTMLNCAECHVTSPPHDANQAHDQLTTSAQCSSCHATETFAAIATIHKTCNACHKSIRPDVVDTIKLGKSGKHVQCENCHTLHEPVAAHDKLVVAPVCTSCHAVTAFTDVLRVHRSNCNTCHGTDSGILEIIAKGIGQDGQPVTCDTCHISMHGNAAEVHDNLSTTGNCSGCHASADFTEIKARHNNSCVLCHTSIRTNVIEAIKVGKGVTGTDVNCENCHAGHDGPTAHNNLSTSINCSNCHSTTVTFAGIFTTHTGQCATCHSSSRDGVSAAIALGRSGTDVNCENCHAGHDGSRVHNNLNTSDNCSACHATPAFAAILTTHKNDCALCHTSDKAAVIRTISDSKGSSTIAATCDNCHAAHDGNAVHNHFVTSTNCSKCHFGTITIHDKYLLDAQGKRISLGVVDCALCHTSGRPEVIASINAGKGANGTNVSCTDCHNGHADDHNMLSTVVDCSGCHKSGAFQEIYGLHRTDCLTCHNSLRDDVQVTINLGMQDNPVNCKDCHTVHDGTAIHNKLSTSVNCSNCHMGTTFVGIYSIHKDDCSKCHSSTRSDVIATINAGKGTTGTSVTCENCHVGHSGSHDKLITAPTCSSCHSSANFDAIYKLHLNDCATCHSSTVQKVKDTIAMGAGKTGVEVDCIDCHGNLDHTADHKLTFLPSDGCTKCHVANVAVEHVVNRKLGCVTCHSSIDPKVQAAITNGMVNKLPVYCVDCHGATNHNTDHDQTFVPLVICSNCHYQNVVTEHVDKRKLDCLVCHGSADPKIYGAIDKGMGSEDVSPQPVYCADCHTGVLAHDTAHNSTKVPAANCATCHEDDVAFVHVTERNMSCSVCHENPTYAAVIKSGKAGITVTCDQCHVGIGDHTYAHNHAKINNDGCDKCHAADVAVEHVTNRGLYCTTCHSSTDTTVKTAIATGKANTDVYCTTCHTTMTGHSSAHDMTVLPDVSCAACHEPNVVTEHVDKRKIACSACHNATYAKQIADGRAGIKVSCLACHPTVNHKADHNKVAFPTTQAIACSTCHDVNVVGEHVEKRALSCQVCHGNTAYAAIIASGSGPTGAVVTCDKCHGQPQHHLGADAQNGKCVTCHTATGEFDDAPVQGPCRQCHINASNFVQGLNPTRVVHAYNTLAKITDFGACVACHVPKSTAFKPYHAKPTTRPDIDTINTAAPGRGTFNIFYSELNRRSSRGESYGESRGWDQSDGQRNQSLASSWSRPAISYNMLAVSHAGVSYTVPTFDQPAPPVVTLAITSLDRTSGSSGTSVRIYGTKFGATQGTSYVLFGTTNRPTISTWSDTQVTFRVPSLSRGTYAIKVVVGGVSSNSKNFTIN